MANPCLDLIKGNEALEAHFKGIENLPLEEQRMAIIEKSKEYNAILHKEIEMFKKSINPKYKIVKFVPENTKDAVDAINASYEEKIKALTNEATPTSNITPDGNVQPGIGKVGEMAVEQKPKAEVVAEEVVQPANAVGDVEGEVQQKQLTDQQKKSNRLLDLKSEFNSLKNREKKGKKGAELRLRIATIAGELDYKVDEKLGKISITRKYDGKNVGKVSFKEEIKESEQSDIDFVKGQIEYGALAWNGDPTFPRINLGISRADITKGVADIQAGKVNSVPAKRLVQAMVEQRKKGVYEFIQGSGQNVERLEVPIVENLNKQEQEVADALENYHTDEEISQYFTELEQLNKQENENTESVTEKIDDTSDSETIIEKPAVKGKDNVKEKITEDQLPTKKGEKSVIAIGENVEAVVTVGKDLSGEPTLIVSILKDGEVQEDKFGDTEVEFSMDEKAEALKFIEDKKRGYSLAGKGKKGKDVEGKEDIESGKNVTFELFGDTKNGVLQSDGSIIGTDGTRYTPSMVKNVKEVKPATKKELDAIKNQLDKWDRDLGKFGQDVLGMNLPIVVARVAIKSMKLAVSTAQTTIDVVKAGIDAIKDTDWYKNLSEEKKLLVNENSINSLLQRTIQASIEIDNKLAELRQKVKDGKASKRQIVNDLNAFLALNAIDGILTPAQARVLIKKANNILLARDTNKAFNNFVDYYEKVKDIALSKVNKNKKAQMDFAKIDKQVNDMLNAGKTKQEIIDSFKRISEKEMAENILTRIEAQTMTEQEAMSRSEKTFQKAIDRINNAQKKLSDIVGKIKNWKTRLFDSMNEVKKASKKFSNEGFKSSQFTKLEELMIVAKGAAGKALMDFNEKTKKIYGKLNASEKQTLDKIIQLRRIISIDSNRESRGLPPIKHPGYNNRFQAEKTLEQMRQDLGDKKFNDLMNRADIYFDSFREMLDEKERNGLISKETRDQLFNIDYQPRMFLEYLLDADGNFDFDRNKFVAKSGNLGKEQISALTDGDISELLLDSESILGMALEKHNKSVFANLQNTRMIEDFLDAMQELDDLKNLGRPLTKEETKRLKDLNYSKDLIIDNPIVGVTNQGNTKYQTTDTPSGYKKVYYFKNGVRHEFFLKEDLHDSMMGNNKFESVNMNNGIIKFLLLFPKALKAIATGRNPFFFITNVPRDFIQTLTFSPEFSQIKPLAFFQITKGLVKAVYNYAIQSDSYKKYFEYGGSMEFLAMQGDLSRKSLMKDFESVKGLAKITNLLTENGKFRSIAKGIFDGLTLHEANIFAEIAFRQAIFNKAIENRLKDLGVKKIEDLDADQQRDVYISAVASSRSIMNFSEGGTYTKAFEPLMPYLNALSQGTRVAFESFEKRPIETSLAVVQTVAMGLVSIIGATFYLIGIGKDDDDERTVMEIYLDNMETVSRFEKQNFHIIFDGTYNDEGMPNYYRIAKTQQITPFTTIAEHYMQNHFREVSGRKQTNDLFDKVFDASKDNVFILPIDPRSPDKLFRSVGKTVVRNPLAGSALSYLTGYDFFRDAPLSYDINKTTIRGEGLKSDRVEAFYKKFGEETGASPARTKAAVEAIFTSPETNPLIGIMYGGLDSLVDDPVFKDESKTATDKVLENINRRIYRSGTEFNRELNMKKAFEKEYDDAKYEMEKQDAEISKISKDLFEEKLTDDQILKKIEKVVADDPIRAESIVKKIENRTADKYLSGIERDLKYETDNRLLAIRLYSYFGDIQEISDKEFEKVKESIENAGITKKINTTEFVMEYQKIIEANKAGN